LKLNLENAKTNERKVYWLGQLAQLYMSLDRKVSEDYSNQQQQIAELSRDRSLMVTALLSNARRHYNMSAQQENIDKGLEYSQKAFDLAKESRLDDFQAWSLNYLALGSRSNGDNEKALNYNNLAATMVSSSNDDSLKISVYNSMANTYLAKKEKMLAFRNYIQALDIAERNGSYYLLRSCYGNMSNFYNDLEDREKAKDFAYKVLKLTYRYNKKIDRIDSYNTLGRYYTASKQYDLSMTFFEKALALSDSVNFPLYKLNTYGFMLDMFISNNKVQEALDFFNSKPEFKAFLKNAGFEHIIDQAYGIAYMEMNKFDSALYYLKKAEPAFVMKSNKFNLVWFYNNMASFYKKRSDYKTALEYTLKAKAISDGVGDLNIKQQLTQNLDSIYQKLGDYKNAYYFNRKSQQLKDSLDKLSTEKEIMALEVDNENKRKERESAAELEATRTRHNLQYMGITAAIAGVFIVLVMFGIFSVSPATIRILGFFAFIFLFEFIILLADNQIHHWTHGEPWKILAIKIGLISILLPLHHFMEEKVIHYLTSRKMLELNKNGLLAKIMPRKEEA
jgi:tetratricopeptide (TPR) repeat protein